MSEPENDAPYSVPQSTGVSEDPGELQTPGVLATIGIVIVSLGAGFTGFFGTCFGGVLAADLLNQFGLDVGAGILLVAVLSLAIGLWMMIVTSRGLYRVASRSRGNRR